MPIPAFGTFNSTQTTPKKPPTSITIPVFGTVLGVGKKPATPVSKPKAKPPSPLDSYLAGDATYQDQLAQYLREQREYDVNYNRQRQLTDRDYNTTKRAMDIQAVQDRRSQQNDFAGRGILTSGVYATALKDYNNQFNQNLANLATGRTDTLSNLATGRTNFLRQLDLEKQGARQEAIRRRAQRLGI